MTLLPTNFDLSKPLEKRWVILYFTVFFFLCSADQYFAVRVFGFNFRYGQILILLGVLWTFRANCTAETGTRLPPKIPLLLINWVPFFLLYGLAALTSEYLTRSLLKEGWALFNIGGLALIFSDQRWARERAQGIAYGILMVALVLWIQFLAIYLGGAITGPCPPAASQPIIGDWLQWFPLGYAQNTLDSIQGQAMLRPNGFYFEPSYAGCALAFSFPIVWGFFHSNKTNFQAALIPALVGTAVFMTSSRSGILSILVSLSLIALGSLWFHQTKLLNSGARIVLLCLLLLGILLLSPQVQKFAGYFDSHLGPSVALSRVSDPRLSEGGRWADMRSAVQEWMKHPFLGNGVTTPSRNQGLGQETTSMWLEIAKESGLFGLSAFLFAVIKTIVESIRSNRNRALAILGCAALAAHGLVDMNFTSTFPRLDYWILFFLACDLLRLTPKHLPESLPSR